MDYMFCIFHSTYKNNLNIVDTKQKNNDSQHMNNVQLDHLNMINYFIVGF